MLPLCVCWISWWTLQDDRLSFIVSGLHTGYYSPPYSAEITNDWIYTSSLPIWLHEAKWDIVAIEATGLYLYWFDWIVSVLIQQADSHLKVPAKRRPAPTPPNGERFFAQKVSQFENSVPLGYEAESMGIWIPTVQGNACPRMFLAFIPLQMNTIGRLETSELDYPLTQRHILKEQNL